MFFGILGMGMGMVLRLWLINLEGENCLSWLSVGDEDVAGVGWCVLCLGCHSLHKEQGGWTDMTHGEAIIGKIWNGFNSFMSIFAVEINSFITDALDDNDI